MKQVVRKILPAIFVGLAVILGAWSVLPAQSAFAAKATKTPKAQKTNTSTFTGNLNSNSPLIGAQPLLTQISSYSFDMTSVSSGSLSAFDRSFIDAAAAQNQAGMQIMETALKSEKNANLRNLLQVMMAQHMKDQETLTALRSKAGLTSTVSLTSAPVLAGSPAADLGYQTVDLQAKYISSVSKAKSSSSYGRSVLDQLIALHGAGISDAVLAQSSASSAEIKGLAKHLADEESLHLEMMTFLRGRMYFGQKAAFNIPGAPSGSPSGTPSVQPTTGPTFVPTQLSTATAP